MRKLKIKPSRASLLTLTRSHQWTPRMVYILTANKHLRYRNGRSQILYIGTTKKGPLRPAASAVNKVSMIFYKLHGIKAIDVHIVTCGPRRHVPTWKRLEASLLDTFRTRYFELPKYNKVRPRAKEKLFSDGALRKIVDRFDHQHG